MASTSPATKRVYPPWEKWYHRAVWRNLRTLVLARDPICMMCHRFASTVADHVIPHKGNWTLFCDLNNLQGLCDTCHSAKTAMEDGGFGNPRATAPETNEPTITGGNGKQFKSSSISAKKLDTAMEFDVNSLLDGIPE